MSILNDKPEKFKDKIINAPKLPGCYIYKNEKGEILYIGKAKNILNRVKSYFTNFEKLDLRIQSMIEKAYEIEFFTVDSEIDSIILETNLIKKYSPKYNILMRDDKNYSWVLFEKYKKGVNDFPRIRIVREKNDKNGDYFGPFPNRLPLTNILKRIRKVFPYASCNREIIQIESNPLNVKSSNSTPCLYFHLGLCKAPCAGKESRDNYLKDFKSIKKFFEGERKEILKELEKEMFSYSKVQDYENALLVRNKINDVKYVTSNIKVDNLVDDEVINELKKIRRDEAINELISKLKFPKDKLQNHKNFRIECYDISNIQGTSAVSAMTVMIDGEIEPSLYRRFRIQSKSTPDDFAMLRETLERRFRYLVPEKRSKNRSSKESYDDLSFQQTPDLIIIDGGKGQLSSSYLILNDFGLANKIPIVGLAKREEEIFILSSQIELMDNLLSDSKIISKLSPKFIRVLLERRSESLFLVQRIRDEAHRFGITYHRKLRTKKMVAV